MLPTQDKELFKNIVEILLPNSGGLFNVADITNQLLKATEKSGYYKRVKTTKPTESEKLKYCVGCHCNFYNGNNDLNIKRCWSLDKAKLVIKKKVSINQEPPWMQSPIKVLDCYREDEYIYVDPKA
jgi:hypothetical protein